MTRDSRLKWLIIGVTIVVDTALIVALDLSFSMLSLLWPLGFAVVLVVAGVYYRQRGESAFVLCVNTLLHLVLFSSAFAVLMYCAATSARPLIDEHLVNLDLRMGVHLPDVLAWGRQHPGISRFLEVSYDTLLPQTAVVIAVLGLRGQRRPLEVFMQRLMVSAWLTVAVFFLYPAAGPFEAFGYERNDSQDRYMAHFAALRSGEMRTISLSGAEGLITFPSFHTTWAMLMALSLWDLRGLFVFSAALNTAVVISTMTTGWHYLSDVLAGLLVLLLAITICRALGRWIYAPARQVHAGV